MLLSRLFIIDGNHELHHLLHKRNTLISKKTTQYCNYQLYKRRTDTVYVFQSNQCAYGDLVSLLMQKMSAQFNVLLMNTLALFKESPWLSSSSERQSQKRCDVSTSSTEVCQCTIRSPLQEEIEKFHILFKGSDHSFGEI